MSDQAARDRIEGSLDESLLVEAAAGTGKTTALVRRLVAVLETGRAVPGSIAAVTFTRKAAGELTLRLRDALDRRRLEVADPECRRRLEAAIHHLEEARIGTIHSFCADLLRERPVEAGVDPDFVPLEDAEAQRLFRRVFRRWLEEALSDLPPGVARALDRLSLQASADSPIERLESAAWSLFEWRDYPAPWARPPAVGESEEQLVGRIESLARHAAKGPSGRDDLSTSLAPVLEAAAWIERSKRERVVPAGQIEAQLAAVRRGLGPPGRYRKKGRGASFGSVPRSLVIAEREQLAEALDLWGKRNDADLVAQLVDDLREPLARWEEEKRRRGVLDFLDLQLLTRDLLQRHADVRAYLQQRFTHVFVDEFQDTDPLQAELLLLLTASDPTIDEWRRAVPAPGKLFLVGDPKQSIYRFRRADVALYRRLKEHLEAAGVGVVTLSKSFRSGARLQRVVNATFEPLLPGPHGAHQADWVPLEQAREDDQDQPAVVVLPVPDPATRWGKVYKAGVKDQLPELVASFVAWVLQRSGWQVAEGGGRRALAPRDICLLFRKSWDFFGGDQTQPFVRALERREIPHLQSGGRSFYEREEVAALTAALTAIEWPDDELAVFAMLRGPFGAIPDAVLLRYRLQHGGLRPFAVPTSVEPGLEDVVAALARLLELHRQRNHLPLAETVRRLLAGSRAWAGFALRPAGAEVLAHVERVIDLARSFELSGGLSFRGFVERLTEQAETRGVEESPIREDGADGVRLMTAHAAKGLEFPIVICADPLTSLARDTPDRWIDADRGLAVFPVLGLVPWELHEHAEESIAAQQAEGVRIAYVAATRARDLLVVPGSGLGAADAWADGWVGPVIAALQPGRDLPDPAPGCPPFGGSTVKDLGPEIDPAAVVVPGRFRLASGIEVVWWSHDALDLGSKEPRGLAHDSIISSSAPAAAGAEWRENWETWQRDVATAVARGAEPSCRVTTVTEQILPPPTTTIVRVERTAAPARRAGGPRFGTLVHTALRDLRAGTTRAAVATAVRAIARVVSAPAEEIGAAIAAVEAALGHPLLVAAAEAERCHAEWPFVMPLPDTTEGLVEGVIDLAYRVDGRWTVVDFKTDLEWSPMVELEYQRQVAWYVWALAQGTGEPVEGVVLRV